MYKMWRRSRSVITGDGAQYMMYDIRCTYGGDCDDAGDGDVQTRCIASLQQIYTAFYAHTATAATVLAAAYRRDASRLYNKYTRRSTHIRQRRCWRQRTDAMHRVSTMQYTIPSHDNIVLGKRQYSDSPLQQWNIKRDNKDDWFSITNVATKRCMTVESDGTRHGSYIIDDKYNGRDNQRFRFIPVYTLF
jgi:hypothetical protein